MRDVLISIVAYLPFIGVLSIEYDTSNPMGWALLAGFSFACVVEHALGRVKGRSEKGRGDK